VTYITRVSGWFWNGLRPQATCPFSGLSEQNPSSEVQLKVSTTTELPRYSVQPRRALKVATRIGKGTKKLLEMPLTGHPRTTTRGNGNSICQWPTVEEKTETHTQRKEASNNHEQFRDWLLYLEEWRVLEQAGKHNSCCVSTSLGLSDSTKKLSKADLTRSVTTSTRQWKSRHRKSQGKVIWRRISRKWNICASIKGGGWRINDWTAN
jgi:hypothetical protein